MLQLSSLDKSAKRFTRFCAVSVSVICLAIFILFTVWAFTGTVDVNTHNSCLERIDYHSDLLFVGVLLTGFLFTLVLLCRRGMKSVSLRTVTAVSLVFSALLGACFLISCKSSPTNDSYIVSNAAYLASQGDGSALAAEYFMRCPYQLGYVFFSEICIRILHTGNNYLAMEYVNLAFLLLTYFALGRTAKLLWGENAAKLFCLFSVLYVPAILFCSFTYGNIPGLGFVSVALWQTVALSREDRRVRRYLRTVAIALCIGAAVTVKKNNTIVFIAVLIILTLRLISRRRLCDLVCIVLCVVSVVGMGFAVQKQYELRFDLSYGKGVSMTAWAAMGLNEAYIAPGWYSADYVVAPYRETGGDYEEMQEIAAEQIKERLLYFIADNQYAADFFAKKLQSQWNEPTAQSIWTNQVRGHYGEMSLLATWICGDGESAVKGYMNIFGQMLYALCAVACVLLAKKKDIDEVLLPTVIVGGVLYHLLCEAKSQYALTYCILMLPLGALATERIGAWVSKKIKSRTVTAGIGAPSDETVTVGDEPSQPTDAGLTARVETEANTTTSEEPQ